MWAHDDKVKSTHGARGRFMTLLASINRLGVRRNLSSVMTLLFLCWVVLQFTARGTPSFHTGHSSVETLETYPYEERGPFYSFSLTGYDNNEVSGRTAFRERASCVALRTTAELGFQKSWLLEDDIGQIAMELRSHPMVRYSTEVLMKDPSKQVKANDRFELTDLLVKSWSRLSNSCCLLEAQQVYLCVTRVIFHGPNIVDQGAISFVRGQIYSKSWVHMDHYVLHWGGKEIVFPRILDIPSYYRQGGLWYGPEDPRIVVESGVHGAEPVIIYNIQEKSLDWRRVMKAYRPFTGHSVILNVSHFTDTSPQKNWSPLILEEPFDGKDASNRHPSPMVHLTYKTTPLIILACDMFSGECEETSRENTEPAGKGEYDTGGSDIRGGTNYMPVPLFDPAIFDKPAQSRHAYSPEDAPLDDKGRRPVYQAFLGLPRAHTDSGGRCERAVYRPEFMLLLTNGTAWITTYVSSPFDLGPGALFSAEDYSDVCNASKWLIGNSIVSWDVGVELSRSNTKNDRPTIASGLSGFKGAGRTDVMTLTLSINDVTSQALRLGGLMSLVKELPSVRQFLNDPASVFEHKLVSAESRVTLYDRMVSTGANARSCAAAEAKDFMAESSGPEGEKRRKTKEEEKKKKEEEEKKKKEEEEKKKKEEEEKKKKEEEEKKKKGEGDTKKKEEEDKKNKEEEDKKKKEEAEKNKVEAEKKKAEDDKKKKDEAEKIKVEAEKKRVEDEKKKKGDEEEKKKEEEEEKRNKKIAGEGQLKKQTEKKVEEVEPKKRLTVSKKDTQEIRPSRLERKKHGY